MSQGEGRLAQGDAITHFRVSIAREERFAEFYTGEGADGRLHHASGQPGESFCRQIFCQTHARRVIHGGQHVGGQSLDLGGDASNGLARLFQPRIGMKDDAAQCHDRDLGQALALRNKSASSTLIEVQACNSSSVL